VLLPRKSDFTDVDFFTHGYINNHQSSLNETRYLFRVGLDTTNKFSERILEIYPKLAQKNSKGQIIKFNQWFSPDWTIRSNWDLLEILRLVNLDNERDMMFSEKVIDVPGKKGTIIGIWNELLVLKWIKDYVDTQLGQYGTSLGQDVEKLGRFYGLPLGLGDGGFDVSELTCTNYLVLEKRLLESVQRFCGAMIEFYGKYNYVEMGAAIQKPEYREYLGYLSVVNAQRFGKY
jgi:hypothetical protein